MVATCLLVVVPVGVLFIVVLLNEGEAVETCPLPSNEPLLALFGDGVLTGDGDGCDLLIDLLIDLPLGWSVLCSVSGFISKTSSSASSSSITRFTGSRFS